jgi:hypothetical protein
VRGVLYYYPLTNGHYLNSRADRSPLWRSNPCPAVRVTRRILSLAPLAPTAVVENDAKRAAFGRLAVLASIAERLERISIANAHISGGGIVEGTVGVSAEAVVVVGAGHSKGR